MQKKQKNKLRNEARNRNCQIRIPGICANNRETVVLCHLNNKRLFGVGMGQKVPDMFGAWGCSACHDAVDGRYGAVVDPDSTGIMFYEAVFRTQNILRKEGKLGEIE